jgi:hypothetical protein
MEKEIKLSDIVEYNGKDSSDGFLIRGDWYDVVAIFADSVNSTEIRIMNCYGDISEWVSLEHFRILNKRERMAYLYWLE